MRDRLARLAAGIVVAAGLAAGSSAAAGGPPVPAEIAARARKAIEKDAEDVRRLAKWGDENGLERTADADWELALALDPTDGSGEIHKRLRYVKRDGVWIRDEASWALARSVPDARPERAKEYEAKRMADVYRASAARHRELAAALRAAGAGDAADEQVRITLQRDPDDLWCRLAVGEVLDLVDGWIPADLQRRRIAEGRAAANARRLKSLGAEPLREMGEGTRSKAAGHPLSVWRLREWRLETDLDDEAAAAALVAADLGARWFRERFGLDSGERVLPGEGQFILLSTSEVYDKVIDGEDLKPAEKAVGKSLSALPLLHEATKGPWVVVIERPDAENAADACLHYALHLLFQARYRVEAQEGWLYEGLAAYGSLRLLGTQASWCVRIEETTAASGPRGDSPETWAEQIFSLASTHGDEPLVRLVGASLNELDGPMLVKAWSVLRFLLEEHPDEAVAFLEAKGAGLSTAKAFAAATGLRVEDVDAAWRLWVLATEGE